MRQYMIYKLTFPNGKTYIGQTSNLTVRFYNYRAKTVKRQPYLYNCLVKYDWDDIIKEIVLTGLSKEEADNQEVKLIAIEKAKGLSVNIAQGGKSGVAKKIVQFDLEGNFIKIWDTPTEICKFLNKEATLGVTNYIGRIAKENKWANQIGNWLWLQEDLHNQGIKPKPSKRGRAIYRLDLKGNILEEYCSRNEAAIAMNTGYHNINGAIINETSHKGFLWEFKDTYNPDKNRERRRKGVNKKFQT